MYETNFIKATCNELNITYKQLSEAIGYSESAIKNGATTTPSEPMRKAISMYREILNLKKELQASQNFKNSLRDFIKE